MKNLFNFFTILMSLSFFAVDSRSETSTTIITDRNEIRKVLAIGGCKNKVLENQYIKADLSSGLYIGKLIFTAENGYVNSGYAVGTPIEVHGSVAVFLLDHSTQEVANYNIQCH